MSDATLISHGDEVASAAFVGVATDVAVHGNDDGLLDRDLVDILAESTRRTPSRSG